MTEEDAKTKWCPFVRHSTQSRYSGDVTNACNRYGSLENLSDSGVVDFFGDDPSKLVRWNKCIGSACMAWRSGTRSAVRHRTTGVVRYLSPGDIYSSLDEVHFTAPDNSNGYCGLAGKPDQ